MIPTRVTPPVAPVVALPDLKAFLRITSGDDDAVLVALEAAAVAHLDGYRGVLGRCIGEQTWSLPGAAGCDLRLPFPDISAVTDAAAVALPYRRDALGVVMTPAVTGEVRFTAALPPELLPVVKAAICMWVQTEFHGITGAEAEARSRSFDAIIGPIRWLSV